MSKAIKKGFFDRLKLSISQNQSLDFMPQWLEENTSHPLDSAKQWSFVDHEFQIDILRSTSHRQTVKKCSQVGLSELAARKALCLATLRQGIQLIYTLPTGAFAQMFAKTRIDPVIENSPAISAIVDNDTNNTKLKRIGSSFMHMVGTYSASSPISIPASYVVSDETDFSDQSVLSEFSSRMGHQKESESANIRFSTPTVEGYSISADFELSSKGRYAVKCECCEQWQIPDFFDNSVVPGYDTPMKELTKYDVVSMGDLVKGAYLACPNTNCKKDLMPSLLNPARRQWVHELPSRQADHEGFQVMPFDVPSVNPVSRTLRQMLDYKKIGSWYNFKLGMTYADDTTKFNLEVVDRNTIISPNSAGVYGAVVGVDVGKISWVSVGVPYCDSQTGDVDQLDVIDLIRIDTTQLPADSTLGREVVKIASKYGASVIVVDAAPDFTTAQHVHKLYLLGKAYGNYYVADKTFAKALAHYKTDDNKGICLSARTASLDDLCDNVNSGRVRFPRNKNMEDVKSHLDAIKRVDGLGDAEARWVTKEKTDDHWAHSLNYLLIAAQISGGGGGLTSQFSLLPSISSVKIKANTPLTVG